MSYDPIDLGTTANDRTGNKWRDGGLKINAMFSALFTSVAANILAIAANAQAIIDAATYNATQISDVTALITGFTKTYWFDANADSKDALWNPLTNLFDFTSLKIGDTVFFRVDIRLTNAAAQEVDLFMSIAEGSAGPYEKNMNHAYYKTASTLANDTVLFEIYIGDENTRTGGARFRLASVDAATIIVNGWYYRITSV